MASPDERILIKKVFLKEYPTGFERFSYMMKCLNCGKEFNIREGPFKNGQGKTCSKRCMWKLCAKRRRGRKHLPETIKKMSEARKGNPIRSVGSKNHFWKGGKWRCSHGYTHIWKPNHPFATKDNYVREHRLVMEKKLGRFLYPGEVVHHINGAVDDNRVENLQLFSKREHDKFHITKRWKDKR